MQTISQLLRLRILLLLLLFYQTSNVFGEVLTDQIFETDLNKRATNYGYSLIDAKFMDSTGYFGVWADDDAISNGGRYYDFLLRTWGNLTTVNLKSTSSTRKSLGNNYYTDNFYINSQFPINITDVRFRYDVGYRSAIAFGRSSNNQTFIKRAYDTGVISAETISIYNPNVIRAFPISSTGIEYTVEWVLGGVDTNNLNGNLIQLEEGDGHFSARIPCNLTFPTTSLPTSGYQLNINSYSITGIGLPTALRNQLLESYGGSLGANTYMSRFNNIQCPSSYPTYINIYIGDQAFQIPYNQLVVQSGTTCTLLAYEDTTTSNTITIGSLLLANTYVYYDQANRQLGIGNLTRSSTLSIKKSTDVNIPWVYPSCQVISSSSSSSSASSSVSSGHSSSSASSSRESSSASSGSGTGGPSTTASGSSSGHPSSSASSTTESGSSSGHSSSSASSSSASSSRESSSASSGSGTGGPSTTASGSSSGHSSSSASSTTASGSLSGHSSSSASSSRESSSASSGSSTGGPSTTESGSLSGHSSSSALSSGESSSASSGSSTGGPSTTESGSAPSGSGTGGPSTTASGSSSGHSSSSASSTTESGSGPSGSSTGGPSTTESGSSSRSNSVNTSNTESGVSSPDFSTVSPSHTGSGLGPSLSSSGIPPSSNLPTSSDFSSTGSKLTSTDTSYSTPSSLEPTSISTSSPVSIPSTASNDLSSTSGLPYPIITGYFVEGGAQWEIIVFGHTVPIDDIYIEGHNDRGNFLYSTGDILIDNSLKDHLTYDSSSAYYARWNQPIEEGSTFVLKLNSELTGAGPYINRVQVLVSDGIGQHLQKRDISSFDLSFTLSDLSGSLSYTTTNTNGQGTSESGLVSSTPATKSEDRFSNGDSRPNESSDSLSYTTTNTNGEGTSESGSVTTTPATNSENLSSNGNSKTIVSSVSYSNVGSVFSATATVLESSIYEGLAAPLVDISLISIILSFLLGAFF
ncbi:hypothetical protein WICMUC_004094 [Wickerhamomyces mucosus]|uniref:Peptidase A1 domain-containing protein n=1 Tax=Wickerhamomyces mucosus TaxID=1378264 RepID=A0A9P8PIT8_9ASCO|nr:hypothetical protein WICMUC_004094 [Wickerhamomyces mucosus]